MITTTCTCDHCGKDVNGGAHITYSNRQYKDGEAVPMVYMTTLEPADFCDLACLTGWALTMSQKFGYHTRIPKAKGT